MTPQARVQAAIELLDEIVAAAASGGAAADTIIARYFKTRRYAGSKDRRAVRDLVYAAIRRSGERPSSGRAAILGLVEDDPVLLRLFVGSAHARTPTDLNEGRSAAAVAPRWMKNLFDPLVNEREQAALLGRASLDLRVNSLKASREDVVPAFEVGDLTPLSSLGIRLPEGLNIERHELLGSGVVEIQDEGSQLLALACGAKAGMTVIDLCAGAGGKTLALAAEMRDQGRIIACDVDRARLSRMAPRVERAGASIVETRLLNGKREREGLADLQQAADIVLVDAPCSGTGTWRRNPEARWRLDERRLGQLVRLQAHILDIAWELVRPGGALVYAVCSVLRAEGRDQAHAFGVDHSGFIPEVVPINGGRPAGSGRLLTPLHDGTDGFFVARWKSS